MKEAQLRPEHYDFGGRRTLGLLVRLGAGVLIAYGLLLGVTALEAIGRPPVPGRYSPSSANGASLLCLWVAYRSVKSGMGIMRFRSKEWKAGIWISSAVGVLFLGLVAFAQSVNAGVAAAIAAAMLSSAGVLAASERRALATE